MPRPLVWIGVIAGLCVLGGSVWVERPRHDLAAPVAAHGTRTPDGWMAQWDVSAGYPVAAPADGHLGPRLRNKMAGAGAVCPGSATSTFTAADGDGVLVMAFMGMEATPNRQVHAGEALGKVAACAEGKPGLVVAGVRVEGSRADAVFSLDRWSSLLDLEGQTGVDLPAYMLTLVSRPQGEGPRIARS